MSFIANDTWWLNNRSKVPNIFKYSKNRWTRLKQISTKISVRARLNCWHARCCEGNCICHITANIYLSLLIMQIKKSSRRKFPCSHLRKMYMPSRIKHRINTFNECCHTYQSINIPKYLTYHPSGCVFTEPYSVAWWFSLATFTSTPINGCPSMESTLPRNTPARLLK